jgi:hypothetical protein
VASLLLLDNESESIEARSSTWAKDCELQRDGWTKLSGSNTDYRIRASYIRGSEGFFRAFHYLIYFPPMLREPMTIHETIVSALLYQAVENGLAK